MSINQSRFMSVALICICLSSLSSCGSKEVDLSTVFPDLPGWETTGPVEFYSPETLFDYIDGGADIYIEYGFQELAAVTYNNDREQNLTVEVYCHGDSRGPSVMYGQERPGEPKSVAVGQEGYYESGFLAFVHGRFYVKLIGFGFVDEDGPFFESLGKQIADKLPAPVE